MLLGLLIGGGAGYLSETVRERGRPWLAVAVAVSLGGVGFVIGFASLLLGWWL